MEHMRLLKIGLPFVIVSAALFITSIGSAKPAYMQKEKKGCTFCHTTAKGGKADTDLTDAGKYYKNHDHSLEGYKGK
jgi:hypothetical protein